MIVCTEVGEIILCETDGSFMNFIPESPVDNDDFKIEAVIPFSRGFIIAGNSSGADGVNGNGGKFYAYEKCEDDRVAYRLISKEPFEVRVDQSQNVLTNMNYQISSIALSQNEDYIYFTTKSNQIMKVDIPLYDGAETIPRFDFVHCCFHSQPITGLDVCIRKQLIVTCSQDKTIKIWNYVNKTLEITYLLQEDALAVAFHPSGFHIIVAITDKIILLNLLSKSLHPFKSLQIKACREVQFSNGGHLFAVAAGSQVQVFNFYTGESPSHFLCKGNSQKVRSISWFDDDMGLASASQGGDVYFFDLIKKESADSSSNKIGDGFVQKSVQLCTVVGLPDKKLEVLCAGNDKRIWNNTMVKQPFDI